MLAEFLPPKRVAICGLIVVVTFLLYMQYNDNLIKREADYVTACNTLSKICGDSDLTISTNLTLHCVTQREIIQKSPVALALRDTTCKILPCALLGLDGSESAFEALAGYISEKMIRLFIGCVIIYAFAYWFGLIKTHVAPMTLPISVPIYHHQPFYNTKSEYEYPNKPVQQTHRFKAE